MLPKAAKTAMNLSASPQERNHAMSELQQQFAPTASDLPPPGDVDQLVQYCLQTYEEQDMLKSGTSQVLGAWNGLSISDRDRKGPLAPKTVFTDERGIFGNIPGGYRRRASMFGNEQMRMLVEAVPLINAIIGRRERTVQRFLRPSERDRDVGFEIRRKDDERPLRRNDDAMERDLTEYVLHSGMESNPIKMRSLKRDTLTQFTKKSIRDLLTLDAWAIETVMTRNGRQMAGYHAIDAATVFLASEEGYEGDDEIIAVQIINGMPVTTYDPTELVYVSQNPRTDIIHQGYGYPYPEMVVKVVTGYLNALTYNLRGFDSNAIPKGLLNIYGNYDKAQLRAFKQQWNAMVKGVNNAWALPVLVSDSKESSAQYQKLGNDFSDMMFAKWMTLLTSIICSIYGMDPTEVYSESFTAGRSSLSGSDRSEALADARDTGLEPLMTFIESTFTDHLIARISPDHKFRFFGLQPVDRQWRQEMTKLASTVNEAREQDGREPMSDPLLGNAPLNPSLTGIYLQKVQAEQAAQQAQAGQPGQPGQDPAQGEEPKEETEPKVEESGDREGPPESGQPTPQLEEQGNRGEGPQGDENNPFGTSSMMRKSRIISARDILVVG